MKKIWLSLLVFSILTIGSYILDSCSTIDKTKPLQGTWQCVSWTAGGKNAGYDIMHTSFHFMENELYDATITGRPEKGTYYMQDGKLYTTAEGNAKIMTVIEKLKGDSLILSMNRGGTMEEMMLIRVDDVVAAK